MSNTTIDNLTDQLQCKVFQNLIDLVDFRNCRLVSQKWKRIVMDACRNKFHLVYPLTNTTLHTVDELKDAVVSFDISAFTIKEYEGEWARSGIELLLQNTEWLQFSGSEVCSTAIRKIFGLTNDSLKMLSFKLLENDLTRPFLGMQKTFTTLRKLSIGFYCSQIDSQTFNTFTCTLEKWSGLDCEVQLPVLESLKLYFDCRSGSGPYSGGIEVTTEELFKNYFAIAKLMLKFKLTLREIEIERVFNPFTLHNFEPQMLQPRRIEMECELKGFDELKLNRLKLSTRPCCRYEANNCNSEIEVLGRPKNLKNVLFQHLIVPKDHWPLLIETLSSFNNGDACLLTSVKLILRFSLHEDCTNVINLRVMKECINLKTLWLNVNSINGGPLLVRNVNLLSKKVSVLHFQYTNEHRNPFLMGRNEIFATQQQVRWIIDNLRELESFSISLLIPEQTDVSNNNEQIEAAGANNNVNDDAQPQQQIENRLANINLQTFRDLIAMPKLKNLHVEMMKAIALDIVVNGLDPQASVGTTLEIVREYSDLCGAAGYTTTTTTSPNFGAHNYNGFATLKIQRNEA